MIRDIIRELTGIEADDEVTAISTWAHLQLADAKNEGIEDVQFEIGPDVEMVLKEEWPLGWPPPSEQKLFGHPYRVVEGVLLRVVSIEVPMPIDEPIDDVFAGTLTKQILEGQFAAYNAIVQASSNLKLSFEKLGHQVNMVSGDVIKLTGTWDIAGHFTA